MKLTLIGGGGVRSPLFLRSALKRAGRMGLAEVCLMDTDPDRLRLMGGLCRQVAVTMGSPVRIAATTRAEEALDGAGYVVTSIRVGGDQARVLDERIALRHRVLGQETTGPGGFAMAMRSIPSILGYAELMQRYSPGAWMFNFTNPAGLVAQALRQRGFDRTIGICDGANQAAHDVARWLRVDVGRLRPEVFGLNHLSWTRRVLLDGEDVLAPLLANSAFLAASHMSVFDRELVDRLGMWINEYLFYFYYAERAVQAILADGKTRGEEVLDLNHRLMELLEEQEAKGDPAAALATYFGYNHRRNATYMHYARPEAPSMAHADQGAQQLEQVAADPEAGEGYAGVALDVIQALEADVPNYIALNVPNQGAIAGMLDSDVVEVSCVADKNGVRPLPIGAVPEPQELLMRSVKLYERLAVKAILERSRTDAVMALMAHPLVLSYSLAQELVDDYLAAHEQHVGNWA